MRTVIALDQPDLPSSIWDRGSKQQKASWNRSTKLPRPSRTFEAKAVTAQRVRVRLVLSVVLSQAFTCFTDPLVILNQQKGTSPVCQGLRNGRRALARCDWCAPLILCTGREACNLQRLLIFCITTGTTTPQRFIPTRSTRSAQHKDCCAFSKKSVWSALDSRVSKTLRTGLEDPSTCLQAGGQTSRKPPWAGQRSSFSSRGYQESRKLT